LHLFDLEARFDELLGKMGGGGSKSKDKDKGRKSGAARSQSTPTAPSPDAQGLSKVKMLLLGDPQVGKTSLILRITTGEFPNGPAFIQGDYKVKKVVHEGTALDLEVHDTGGVERFRSLTASHFVGANGVLIVFDLTEKKSLQNVATWKTEIDDKANAMVPCFLIGNKKDLLSDRAVNEDEAKTVAEDLGCKYLELSAKSGENVEIALKEILPQLVDNAVASKKR